VETGLIEALLLIIPRRIAMKGKLPWLARRHDIRLRIAQYLGRFVKTIAVSKNPS
jgi:hypothetical protein